MIGRKGADGGGPRGAVLIAFLFIGSANAPVMAEEKIIIAIFNGAGVEGEAEKLADELSESDYEIAKVGSSGKELSRPLIGVKPDRMDAATSIQDHLTSEAKVMKLKCFVPELLPQFDLG